MSDAMLSEPWKFHFPYTRTAGPTVGRFLTELQNQRVFGLEMSDGRVLVPPHPYDPQTAETLTEWVEVAHEGEVVSWTWIEQPLAKHPLQHPFAFALIQLDGADTPMLHALDTGGTDVVSTGMRVKIRWAPELRGRFSDIACFVPVDAPEPDDKLVKVEPETDMTPEHWQYPAPFTTNYEILAGRALSLHLKGLQERKLIGFKGPSGNIHLPPNGADPVAGELLYDAPIELPQTGTVVRYCIVNIPVRDQSLDVPFACADILIDGADNTFMALIQGLPHSDVRLGLRVRAVWVDDDQLAPSLASIKWFEPTGEPDCNLSEIEAYL